MSRNGWPSTSFSPAIQLLRSRTCAGKLSAAVSARGFSACAVRPSDPGAPLHAWTVAAATPHVWPGRRTCTVKGRQVRVGSGYQWWPLSGGEGFTAKGVQGQFLHILPGLDTVVVQFGSRPEGPAADRTARNRAECHVYAAHRFLAEHAWPLPR